MGAPKRARTCQQWGMKACTMRPMKATKRRADAAANGAVPAARIPRGGRQSAAPGREPAGDPRGDDPSIRQLGARLQALRAARGWTLGELASQCGVSRSSLSKIERNEVSPTYDAIQRIARGFDIPVVEFFSEKSDRTALGRRAVGRADDAEMHQGRGYVYQLLCNELSTKSMLPYVATINARSLQEAGGYIRHAGEELLFVLSGSVEFFTEHYAPVRLAVGDSIYLDSQMGHACVSTSEVPAKVLWIVSDGRVI
jgi:transcriptional regulator with XRE-family HTH domain